MASTLASTVAAWLAFRLYLPLILLVLLKGSASATEAVALASELEAAQCELADLSAAGQRSCIVPAEVEAEPEPARESELDALAARGADAAAAPMCDRTAASVVAGIEVPEVDRGRFEQLPCNAERWLALLGTGVRASGEHFIGAGDRAPQPRQPAPGSRSGRPEAIASFQLSFAAGATPTLLPAAARRGLTWQPGHPSPIYRPPTP